MTLTFCGVHSFIMFAECFIIVLQDVVRYSLEGPEDQLRYFYLNPDDGVLILRRSMAGTPLSEFNVCLHFAFPWIYKRSY